MDIQTLVQNVIDGEESGLLALAVLKEEKKLIDKAIKEVEDCALDEAATYTDKSFDCRGYKFEKRNGGRVWNFKEIPEWQAYDKAKKDCEDRHKQAFISLEKGLQVASDDGEEIVMPIVTYRKDSLVIKIVD